MQRIATNPDNYIALANENKVPAQDGDSLHIVDTGEEFICYQGMWFLDLRKVNALKISMKTA
jgi:hypothetical protein